MGAEVPSLGGVSHIGGEDRRQLRSRNAGARPKGHSGFEASDSGNAQAQSDPLEIVETPVEIVHQPEAEAGALPMGTANGLTLADVKAAYDAS